MSSIRRRLLAWLLAGVAAAIVIGAASIYAIAREQANSLFDYQLQQTALSFRDHALHAGLIEPRADPEVLLDIVVQIWDRYGLRLYISDPRAGMPERARLGFADVQTSEGRWRVFSVRLADHVVQVAQPYWVRERLAAAVALRTVWPLIAMLPLLAALMWLTVGRGLAPLERIAQELRGRSSRALAPVAEQGLPSEVQPLAHSLNDLLARLEQSIEAQRAFVADAAHELRTPLTALRVQAQLAARAADETERAEAIALLEQGIERASHLVQQLLALADAEAAVEAASSDARVPLDEVAREALADLSPLALRKGVDLGLERAEPLEVRGERLALHTVIANLLENAVKYTPVDGRVDLSLRSEDGAALLSVTDTGPGIPAADRERVFDRFYRRPGQAEPGSGLGLAIVRRIIERMNGAVWLEDAPSGRGLRVIVRLPRT